MKTLSRTSSVLLTTTLLAAAAAVYAQRDALFDAGGPLPPPVDPRYEIEREPVVSPSTSMVAALPEVAPNLPNDYGVDHAQVGDADSFGRNLRWLGATQGLMWLDIGCPRADLPATTPCVRIPNMANETLFDIPEVAKIDLPARASTSQICQWFSPQIGLTHQNSGTTRAYSYLSYWPVVTIRSEALAGPINAISGQPFDGKIVMPLTSHGSFVNMALEPGVVFGQRSRDSQVCLSGMVSRRTLIERYGLDEATADQVFASPMQISIGLKGVARNIRQGYIQFGTRLIGD